VLNRVLPALLYAAFPIVVVAQGAAPGTNDVIITATRSAESLDATLAPVTVITRADIDRLQPHSVEELLVGLPGVSIAINGDLGKVSSVYLRGTNADHVLVLIDGIKVGSTTTGSAAFEQLPVEQIDRIEIVRGPRSSLYGSEAIGGVIQIFTRHGTPGEAPVPSFDLSAGSHATYQSEAGYSGSGGNGWYNASVSGLSTHGISICSADAPVTASCYTTLPQQGFWSESLALSGGYRVGDATELSLRWLRADGDTKFNGSLYSGNESREVQQVIGAGLTLQPIANLSMTLTSGRSVDQSSQYYSGTPTDFFNTRRDTLSWLGELSAVQAQKISFGVDYEQDKVDSDVAYAVRERSDVGVFGLYQWTAGAAELQLSERSDHNRQFGNHSTGSVAGAYRFGDALRLTLSYGTAFKAPAFNDLYYPFYGNPDLRPETSRSSEVGVSGSVAPWNWAVNAYQTQIDQLIEYNPTTFGADNIDRARIRGVEARIGTQGPRWRSQLYLTWLDPRNQGAGGNFGNLLPRRARQTTRWDVDRDFGRLGIGTTLYAADRRFEDPANTRRLGGYATLDLRASWHLYARWWLQALLRNALDKNYETVRYYNQPGRGVYLTLRYSPAALH
jgi:vitamin B12 transporter